MQKFSEKYTKVVPIILLIGIFISSALYFLKFEKLPNIILLVFVGIGILPYIYEMLMSFLKLDFGVDIIAMVGIISAIILGEYLAASIILLMLSGGEYLENTALRHARKEITNLLNDNPQKAHLMEEKVMRDVPVGDVKVGSEIMVKQYEVIPLDGIVLEGESEVDESKLTGESLPVTKIIGSDVMSGSINLGTTLIVKSTELSKNSKFQRIVQLVQETESKKPPFIRLADRYAVAFTFITFVIASLAWILTRDPIRALTVLVVATPCPLILAAPAAFAAGISKLAEKGIILRNPAVIEKFDKANVFLFDKTGTLTFGKPKIGRIVSINEKYLEKDIFQIAFSLDRASAHILARAINEEAFKKGIQFLPVKNYKEEIGYGIAAEIGELKYYFGKTAFIQRMIGRENAKVEMNIDDITSYLANESEVIGKIIFTDEVRPNLTKFFWELTNDISSKNEVLLVTGDKEKNANSIAEKVGIVNVKFEMLPEDKLELVQKYKKAGKTVVMVGDGINDSPAIAASDIGIVIGQQNSNITSEIGDMIIVKDSPELIGPAIKISKYTLYIAKQSIYIGISLSILLMILGAFGLFTPFVGAIMQEVIDVMVILNALRARNVVT